MAVYDLEEQEKIDALKDWWKSYGNAVTAGLVLGALVLGGGQAWRSYRHNQAAKAGDLYFAMQQAAVKSDAKKVLAAAREIQDGYAGSGYAARAALVSAKASFDAGDLETARSQLQWVLDQSKEVELKALAQYRLAGVLADQKKHNEAIAILDSIDNPAYVTLAQDLKGDILVALGRAGDARKAYQNAIDKANKSENLHNLTQYKLDALGGSK